MIKLILKESEAMKNTSNILKFAAFAAIVSVAFSCVREEIEAPAPSGEKFTLEVSLEPQLKTTLGPSDGSGERKVYWSNGDKIAINGVASEPLSGLADETQSTLFTFGETESAMISTPYNVVYPASLVTVSNYNNVTLPDVQTYKAGGFADGMSPMAGYSSDGSSLSLKHLCAVLHISVKRSAEATADTDNIAAVRFKGKAGEQVCGSFAIDYSNATLTGNSTADADKEVRVVKSLATSISTAVEYYLVVPAGTYTSGFEVIVQDANSHIMTKSKSASTTLVAGKVYNMAEFDFVPSGTETGIEIASAEDLIAFATAYNNKEYEALGSSLVATVTQDITFNATTSTAFNATGGIGTADDGNGGTNYFNGVFDGKGYTISGYTGSVPLFAYTGSDGRVRNTVVAADSDKIIASDNTETLFGAFVGYHKGLLENCVSNADITFSNIGTKGHFYGGLVGRNHGGRIKNCTMNGDVICPAEISLSTAADQAGIGGIAGRSNGTSSIIENCHFNGNITISNADTYGGIFGVKGSVFWIGGIVGHLQEGSVVGCDTQVGKTMDMRGTFNAKAGGIVGFTEIEKPSSIIGCTNNMTITFASNGGRSVITPTTIGGVVGYGAGATVTSCTNNGSISTTCDANLLYLGGIAAQGDNSSFNGCNNNGAITHTNYTSAAQTARYITMGGIVGIFSVDATNASTVENCRNNAQLKCNQLGTSTNTTVELAGIVGKTDAQPVTIKDCKNLVGGKLQVVDTANKVAFARTALGGILGYSHVANTSVSGCYNSAWIYCQYSQGGTNNRPTYLGGIAGMVGTASKDGCTGLAGLEIKDCHNTGEVQNQNYNNTVTLEGGPIHGGIVGAIIGAADSNALIQDCTSMTPAADSIITGQRGISGGIVGYAGYAKVKNNTASCSISGNNNAVGSGGIAGWMVYSEMSGCTFSGLIGATTGSNVSPKNVGGLVYLMDGNSSIKGDCKVDGATLTKGPHASATEAAVLVSNAASGATITGCGVKGTIDGAAITLSSKMITTDGGATVTGTYLLP